MTLTIAGKEYKVPLLTAADAEEFEELLDKATSKQDKASQQMKAGAELITTLFLRAYPDLERRSVLQAIPYPRISEIVIYLLVGPKKDGELPPAAK